MAKNQEFQSQSIARRLVLLVFAFSSAVTIILTAIQTYQDYKDGLDSIKLQLAYIQNIYAQTLAESVWQLDDKNIALLLEGIINLEDIPYVEVHQPDGTTIAAAGHLPLRNATRYIFPINYLSRGKNAQIGTLTTYASRQKLYDRLLAELIRSLINNGLKTFLVSSFILILARLLIINRLQSLKQLTESLGQGHIDVNRAIAKHQNAIKPTWHDEITQLYETSCEIYGKLRTQLQRNNALVADLQSALSRLATADRAKREFLAKMSHEIRTPLSIILGHAKLLKSKGQVGQTPQHDSLDIIQRNGEYLLAIINDILDFAKIESGQISIDRSPCSLIELLHNIKAVLSLTAIRKGLLFTLEIDPSVPAVVMTDSLRLQEILINLIENAIKYTQQGQVTLVVSAKEHKVDLHPNSYNLVFHVIDTGPGITDEEQVAIFEMFYQSRENRLDSAGLGLGLAICKRLASLLQGSLTVDSKLNAGSTFTLTLNNVTALEMAKPELPEVHPTETLLTTVDPQLNVVGASTLAKTLTGVHILVTEDNQDARDLLCEFLQEAGASVICAHNGRDALNKVIEEAQEFDVILMDIRMPVMDGHTCIKELRKLGYAGPIVAITANSMQSDIDECFAAGCSDYLTKPIQFDYMVKVLEKQVHRFRSWQRKQDQTAPKSTSLFSDKKSDLR